MDICSPLIGLCFWPVNQPIAPAGVRSGRSNSFFDSLTYLYCSKFSVRTYLYCSKFSVRTYLYFSKFSVRTYLYYSKFSVQNYNFGSLNKRFTWRIQRYNEVQHNATSQDTVLHFDKNASLARNALKMPSKQTHLELQTSRGSKIPAHDWLLSLFS